METLSGRELEKRPVYIATVSTVSIKYGFVEAEPSEHCPAKFWVREGIPEIRERQGCILGPIGTNILVSAQHLVNIYIRITGTKTKQTLAPDFLLVRNRTR